VGPRGPAPAWGAERVCRHPGRRSASRRAKPAPAAPAATAGLPGEIDIGGIEHAIMPRLAVRFFQTRMRDAGRVNSEAPA
ncbi:hypothetical protein Q6248_29375, partial [Klebsiella pneumoniae]|uniref:hypothetical protein n=1 Tax=Klebsiella pneumoniae TaxID=573 RepID=UPI0027305D52